MIDVKEARALSNSGSKFITFYNKIESEIRRAAMAGDYNVRLTCSWLIDDQLLENAANELRANGFSVDIASRYELKAMRCDNYCDRDFIIRWREIE